MNIPSEYKFWRFPILLKLRYLLASILHQDAVCLTYWINANTFLWSPKIKVYNWGDYINIKLAEMISGKHIIPSKYHISKPMVAMVGSILPWAITKDTIIWGSGCLNSFTKIDLSNKADTYIVEWKEPIIDLDKLLDACPIKQMK